MEIEVCFVGLRRSRPLKQYVLWRIQQDLGRLGLELRKVVVRFRDIHGAEGGIDKRCQVTVEGTRVGTATLLELGDNPYVAFERAASRIADVIGRDVERLRGVKYYPFLAKA